MAADMAFIPLHSLGDMSQIPKLKIIYFAVSVSYLDKIQLKLQVRYELALKE